MFKEKGYDEFLADKICQGEEDLNNGRVVSKAQSLARLQQVVLNAERDLAQQANEYDLSGSVYA